MLLPKTKEHDLSKGWEDTFYTSCMTSCHSFQTRVWHPRARDEERLARGDVKEYMRDVIIGDQGGSRMMSDPKLEDIVSYLTTAFGPDSPKTRSPADMPGYKATLRPFSDKVMNIAYAEYDFAGTKGLGPWSAVEDQDGMVWIPYYGRGNEVVRLNPKTAELTRFPLPFTETAGIHSVIPDPDGTVWFTEVSFGGIGHLNPATKEITEYRDKGPDGKIIGKHTVRVDASGKIWSSGGPISRFDPTTKEFTHFNTPGTYGNVVGRNGDEWFTIYRNDGPIVRISRTGEVTKWYPSTKGKPQRLQVDSDGTVWFTERVGGKIGHLDPESGNIKEFDLPGPSPSPYAIGIDRNHMVMVDSLRAGRSGPPESRPRARSLNIRSSFRDIDQGTLHGLTGAPVVRKFFQQQGWIFLFSRPRGRQQIGEVLLQMGRPMCVAGRHRQGGTSGFPHSLERRLRRHPLPEGS